MLQKAASCWHACCASNRKGQKGQAAGAGHSHRSAAAGAPQVQHFRSLEELLQAEVLEPQACESIPDLLSAGCNKLISSHESDPLSALRTGDAGLPYYIYNNGFPHQMSTICIPDQEKLTTLQAFHFHRK